MNLDFNRLAKEIHANAVDKGFWDKPRNTKEVFMLVISEVGEAVEAHRKGRFADIDGFEMDYAGTLKTGLPADHVFASSFKTFVKDSVGDELADVAIRLLDWVGSGPEIALDSYQSLQDLSGYNVSNFGEVLFDLTHEVVELGNLMYFELPSVRRPARINKELTNYANNILCLLFHAAKLVNADLERHILLKMQYNATRPRLHNKQY